MTRGGYTLHMLSFKAPDSNSYNVAFGNGANLQPWHLDVLEDWIKAQRAKQATDDGSDLV